MSDTNVKTEAKMWREWILTSENLVHKVEGPVYSSSDIIKVIEIGALDELKAENDRLVYELDKSRADHIAKINELTEEVRVAKNLVERALVHIEPGTVSATIQCDLDELESDNG